MDERTNERTNERMNETTKVSIARYVINTATRSINKSTSNHLQKSHESNHSSIEDRGYGEVSVQRSDNPRPSSHRASGTWLVLLQAAVKTAASGHTQLRKKGAQITAL